MVTIPLQSHAYPAHLENMDEFTVCRLAFRKIDWETNGFSYFFINFKDCSAHCNGNVGFPSIGKPESDKDDKDSEVAKQHERKSQIIPWWLS